MRLSTVFSKRTPSAHFLLFETNMLDLQTGEDQYQLSLDVNSRRTEAAFANPRGTCTTKFEDVRAGPMACTEPLLP